ncbi:MAG: metallophosphoesterase family protein [Rectinemataceae bacterium]|nr:metallophosphoesterase family protein [Rectinemataceae bacterium]
MIIRKDEKYDRILAIGDIHGCARHLERLLEAVKPTREDLIVTLGDYIDRGPDSKGVIDILIGLHGSRNINIVSLRGNHDAMLLMCLDKLDRATQYWPTGKCDEETFELWCRAASQEPPRLWLGNQAQTTLSSYGKTRSNRNWDGYLDALSEEFHKGLRDINQEMWDVTADLVSQEHIDFLRDTCVDACETSDFIFVHGGLCPDFGLTEQPLFALHWKRFDKNCKPHVSGKKVICGHTPQTDLLVHDLGHAVCLDTGAYMAKGFLTCMDLMSGQCWQIDDDLQLSPQPVVHYDNRVPFIRIAELPAEEQKRIIPCLMGRSAPFDGCAWPHDYREWWWGKR